MISANVCSIIILLLLIVSTVFRKMSKGSDGKTFLILIVVAFVTSCIDTACISLNNNVIEYGYEAYKSITGLRFFLHTMYLLTRNYFALLFIIYMIALSDRWHRLKSNKPQIVLLAAPYTIIVGIILSNLFTGKLFGFNDRGEYTRGSIFFILYVLAFMYYIGGIQYIIALRKIMQRTQIHALLTMYLMNFIAIGIQFVAPVYHIEMLVNSLSMLIITLFVQRPEDVIDSTTQLRNLNSYVTDLKLNFANKKPFYIILINISNLDSVSGMLDYDNSSQLLKVISQKLEDEADKYCSNHKCYFTKRGKFRITSNCSLEQVTNAAEELNSFFRNGIVINGLEINLIAHVCVIDCPDDISDFRTLTVFASEFHEKIPFSGNVVFGSELDKNNRFKLTRNIDNIIERAIANNSFKVYYQPIYSIEKKKFNSAEALLRLIDEEYGLVPPDIFIPAAEKSGAIHKIGDFVLDDVCRFISENDFNKLGLEYIEINLSVAQCMQKDLAEKVTATIDRYGIDHSMINLEITETAAAISQKVMTANVEKITDSGISLSLDDYGTGYSNIKSVASLPLSIVKLDKTFADEMKNPKMESVLNDTVRMLKNLDMHIVVEGVETAEMLEHFTELKCDYIQGYYFSKPVPENDFVQFILSKNSVTV